MIRQHNSFFYYI